MEPIGAFTRVKDIHSQNRHFNTIKHLYFSILIVLINVNFCVVFGGLSGMGEGAERVAAKNQLKTMGCS